ncbi:MAG: hypothetical protein JST12_14575 [Armatimonadetes bacterium]|nr:hypothetical protein [Armatimonadota bacterium]
MITFLAIASVVSLILVIRGLWKVGKMFDDCEGCPHCGLTDHEHFDESDAKPCPVCKRKGGKAA